MVPLVLEENVQIVVENVVAPKGSCSWWRGCFECRRSRSKVESSRDVEGERRSRGLCLIPSLRLSLSLCLKRISCLYLCRIHPRMQCQSCNLRSKNTAVRARENDVMFRFVHLQLGLATATQLHLDQRSCGVLFHHHDVRRVGVSGLESCGSELISFLGCTLNYIIRVGGNERM